MSKADSRIQGGAPIRNQERKDQENFHTQNYSVEGLLGVDVAKRELKEKKNKEEEDKQVAKPKNFDINFISDETFQQELDYLAYTPHSDLILLLAPKVQMPSKEIIMLPDVRNKYISEQLDKLPSGMRILAISQKAKAQNTTFFTEVAEDGHSSRQVILEEFKVGDYAFFNNNLIILNNFTPLSDHLAYYQTRNMDMRYTMTQEQALKFKPSN